MSKAKIIDKKSVDSILGEKNLLSQLHHSFIVNMIYSFQDHDYLYLVMDLLPGGNLRYHLCIKRRFSEKQNKFLIGCILVGLEYIHSQKILHRDIKPENLVFDANGYLRITDFGIAKKYIVNNKKDTSGTVGYLAPEILCNQNHTYSIDYYAVGIIAYELAYGHRPYIGRSKHEVKQLILTQQAHIDYDELPNGYEDEAADFINQLIQRKPKNRLGRDSISEVINHPWLEGFDWESLKSKKMRAFYVPKEGDNFDKKYCLQSNKLGTETLERYKEIALEPNYATIFKQFDCQKVPEELRFIEPKIKLGETTNNGNNMSNSYNNSTASISRNNKISGYNENKKAANNNYLLSKQRNKSMENILLKGSNQNIINNININKPLLKQKSALSIIAKENKENNLENNNNNNKSIKEEENSIKITINNLKPENKNNNNNNDKKKETKISFKNNVDDSIILNKINNSTIADKKNLIRLIDEPPSIKKYNNNHNNSNSVGNIDYNYDYNKNNNYLNINPNISIKNKDKSAVYENIFDISIPEKNDNKEKELDKVKESVLFNQRLTKMNQYIFNNYKYKKLSKTKFMSNSNSSLNIFPNEMFNNSKGNYFKKIIQSKLLNKDLIKLKNKNKNYNNNNSNLLASNSTKSLFKKCTGLNSSYLKPTKKHFLKNDVFNGTFYQNKSSSTKYFFFPRKSTSSSTNKKLEINNKRLASSSSIRSLKNGPMTGMNSLLRGNLSKDLINNMHNIDKNLPFISLNKKNKQNFRNNFSFVNRNNNRNFLYGNGYFSERIKNDEIKGIKAPGNG